MKIYLPCLTCSAPPDGNTEPIYKRYAHRWTEAATYVFTCDKGHENWIDYRKDRFSVLFEIAVSAVIDGYYREAVTSATASLERFYEFCSLTLTLMGTGKLDAHSVAWKLVASQSERQLGMFIGIYTFAFGEPPTLLPRAMTEFRNEVVHKGLIPDRAQAVAYIDSVFQLERSLLHKLQTINFDAVSRASEHLQAKQKKEAKVEESDRYTALSLSGELSTNRFMQNLRKANAEELIANLEKEIRRDFKPASDSDV